MILASLYGWSVISAQPPTFHDYLLMGQLASEERVGRRIREARGVTAAQDAAKLQRLRQFSE